MSDDLAENHDHSEGASVDHGSLHHRSSTIPPKSTSDLARQIREERLKFEARSRSRRARHATLISNRDDLVVLQSALDIFGDALTFVLLTGQREPTGRTNIRLAASALSDLRNATSLRTAVEIARELLQVEAQSTVEAWFVGQNPMLDDRAPALIVRTDPDAVWEAAKHFVAYG